MLQDVITVKTTFLYIRIGLHKRSFHSLNKNCVILRQGILKIEPNEINSSYLKNMFIFHDDLETIKYSIIYMSVT